MDVSWSASETAIALLESVHIRTPQNAISPPSKPPPLAVTFPTPDKPPAPSQTPLQRTLSLAALFGPILALSFLSPLVPGPPLTGPADVVVLVVFHAKGRLAARLVDGDLRIVVRHALLDVGPRALHPSA